MEYNKHTIGNVTGSGNIINNGDVTQIIHQPPDPNENIMQSLLQDIAKMISHQEILPELPDTELYTIPDKICFNDITKYLSEYDDYHEGLYIIEQRLSIIEDSAQGSIKPQLIRYIRSIYRKVNREFFDQSADNKIRIIEETIRVELEQYYRNKISPEDLSHIEFVVFYIFAICRIFNKPTQEYMELRSVDSQ